MQGSYAPFDFAWVGQNLLVGDSSSALFISLICSAVTGFPFSFIMPFMRTSLFFFGTGEKCAEIFHKKLFNKNLCQYTYFHKFVICGLSSTRMSLSGSIDKSIKVHSYCIATSGSHRNGLSFFMTNDSVCHVNADGVMSVKALANIPEVMCLRMACTESNGTFSLLCPDSGILIGTIRDGALYCIEWKMAASPLSFNVRLSDTEREEHGLSTFKTIMDLDQSTRAQLIKSRSVNVGGVLYVSYPSAIRRIPYVADINSNYGSIVECNLPLGGYFELVLLHGGQTIACVCTNGVMIIAGCKDSIFSGERRNFSFKLIHLCNFGLDRDQPDLSKVFHGSTNDAVPWHAEPLVAFGEKDYLVVQFPDGKVDLLIVPFVGKLKPTLKKAKTIHLGTFRTLKDAVVSDNYVDPLLSLAFADGLLQMPLKTLFKEDFSPFPNDTLKENFKAFDSHKTVAKFLTSEALDIFVDGHVMSSSTFSPIKGSTRVAAFFEKSF